MTQSRNSEFVTLHNLLVCTGFELSNNSVKKVPGNWYGNCTGQSVYQHLLQKLLMAYLCLVCKLGDGGPVL